MDLEAFFRRSLFVLNRLKEVLYKSAFRGMVFPRFPSEMTPLPVVTTEADKRMRKFLKEYSATDR